MKYSYPLVAGLVGILIADRYFPLVDRDTLFVVEMCAFFAPIVFHIVSGIRKRLLADMERLKQAYIVAAAVTLLIALFIACNGGFDHSAATPVSTALLRKQVVRGKSGPSYTLVVRSWRPGRETEKLGVDERTYYSVSSQKKLVVEVHRGALGLPWYSAVFSE